MLVAFNFRSDQTQAEAVDWTFRDAELWISTTSKDTVSTVFADNHGSDKTLVFQGDYTYSLLGGGPPQGPHDFADGMRFQTPFYYDPSQGNLLIEQIHRTSSIPNPSPVGDVQSTTGFTVLGASFNLNAVSGDLFTGLAVTQFEFAVPEPEVATWNVDANGNWSQATNWTGGAVPNTAGASVALTGVITQPRAVTVDAPITIGRIDFDNANSYTLAGTSSITLDANDTAEINVAAGSHVINAPLALADNTVIRISPAASSLALAGGLSGANASLTKIGAGTLAVSQMRVAGLSIDEGGVVFSEADMGGPSVLGSLSIAGDAAPTATLDLTDNAAIINYATTSPAGTVRQQIVAGRGGAGLGATWTGTGITSGTAAAAVVTEPEARAVGYAENSTMPLGALTEFRGQSVDDTSILMAFTSTGDANLDGVVNDDDVTIVGAKLCAGHSATVLGAWRLRLQRLCR